MPSHVTESLHDTARQVDSPEFTSGSDGNVQSKHNGCVCVLAESGREAYLLLLWELRDAPPCRDHATYHATVSQPGDEFEPEQLS